MADEPSNPPPAAAADTPVTPPTNEPAASAAPDVLAADAASQAAIGELLKEPDGQATPAGDDKIDASVEELLKQANFEDAASVVSGTPGADAEAFKLPSFQQVMADAQVSSIDLLRDVELNVKIELGRSRMLVEDVLKLSEGSVVELDKLAGDPVDVFVNDRLVARGEVLVLNDNFCVRVNEIVAGVKEEAD
jgi:flagellar motor switch protein FliN/FliY